MSEAGFLAINPRRAGGHQRAAQPSRARTEIDHVIGALDGFGVVLHDDHGVAHVAQVRQRFEQPVVVARMQPDGWLIEHIEHAAQLGADLRGQPDALRFAARERGRGALEAQIIQAHGREKFEPAADLIDDAAGNLRLALAELPAPGGEQRARNRHGGEIGDGNAFHAHRETGGPQPLAVAIRTLDGRHVICEPLAVAFACLLKTLIENFQDARKSVATIEQQLLRFLGKLIEGNVDRSMRSRRRGLAQPVVHVSRGGARSQAAFEQRLRRIHNHFAGIERPPVSQTRAGLARAVRAVEGERPRLELRNAGAAFRARELLRVEPLFAIDDRDQHQAVGQLGGGFDRSFQALLDAGLYQQAVDDHFDGVISALVERRNIIVERAQHAIDARAHETLARQFFQVLLVFALAPAHDGRHHHDAIFRPQREHVLQNLLGGLPRNGIAADRAVRNADRRIQQAQIIVDFRDGADRRARTAAGGFLLDRNGGAEAFDGIDIRPLHLVEELPGVRGKRLDIAPLALGVDGVEGERGLAGAAQAGDDGEAVARNLDVDVLEIVLARAMHRNLFQHREARAGEDRFLLSPD